MKKALFILLTLSILGVSWQLQKDLFRPFSIEQMLPTDDPLRTAYTQHVQLTDDKNMIYLLAKVKDVSVTPAVLFRYSGSLLRLLTNVQGVDSVNTIANAQFLQIYPEGIWLEPFYDKGRVNIEGIAHIDQVPFWRSTLFTECEHCFLTVVKLSSDQNSDQKFQTVNRIFHQLNYPHFKMDQNIEFHLLGPEILNYSFRQEILFSRQVILPIMLLLISIMFWLFYRSWVVLGLSFWLFLMSYALLFIVIILNEGGVSPYANFALLFLLVVATADLIHFFSELQKQMSNNGEKNDPLLIKEALMQTRKKIIWPCLMTSLTTALGFMALIFSYAELVVNFGIYCTIGTLICFVLTFFALPSLIATFRVRLPHGKEIQYPFAHFIMNSLPNKRWFMLLFFMLILMGIIISGRLQVSDQLYDNFTKQHEVTKAIQNFSYHMGYLGSIDLVIKPIHRSGEESATTLSMDTVALIQNIESHLNKINTVHHTQSIGHLERLIRDANFLKWNDQNILESDEILSILHLFRKGKDFNRYFPQPEGGILIEVFLDNMKTSTILSTIKVIKAQLDSDHHKGLYEYQILGHAALLSHIANQTIPGFLYSFVFIFPILFILFLTIFKSLPFALLAMIPNLIPIIGVGSLIQIFGLDLDSNTIIILCVILGIAVDDTIHLLYHYRKIKNEEGAMSQLELWQRVFGQVASPLIRTTLTFCVAFTAFFLSSLLPFIYVTSFIIIGLLFALASDFFLLPLLLTKSD